METTKKTEQKTETPDVPRKTLVVREAVTTIIENPKPADEPQEKKDAQVARRNSRQS